MANSTSDSGLLGVGLYTPADACHLLRIPASTLRRWIDGYTFPLARWSKRHQPGLFEPALPRTGGKLTLTFLDLVQLRVVRALRLDAKVPLQRIRTAAEVAADLFSTSHPLAFVRFKTEGRRIFASLDGDQDFAMVELSAPAQGALDVFAQLREISYLTETGLAGRWYPNGEKGGVVIDPKLAFGAPVLIDSGVPTHAIWEQSKSVKEPIRLADWFRLDVQRVNDALRYESELARAA
jgi:uncharacterized protein (DUF433 family)